MINRFFICLLSFSITTLSLKGQTQVSPQIIPTPNLQTAKDGKFLLNSQTSIIYNNKLAANKANFLAMQLKKVTGYNIPVSFSASIKKNSLFISLSQQKNKAKEAYHLSVNTNNIIVNATDTSGIFNASQSLLQLLPAEILGDKKISRANWPIASVFIEDSPRFSWRGYMFDVSRTFYSVNVLKKYMDVMALYKLNVLHLHLTDDQGWRIEIKSHPELTSKKTTTFVGKQEQPAERSGFYTQAQIKDLVRYANQRNITIVPEIDVPGHAWPIIITNPQLGVNKKTTPDYVFPFVDSWAYWGFQFTPNPLDPSKEEVYSFLTDVFNEVADLFPSPYIHFGGDEVVHRLWENEPHIKAFMNQKGYTKIAELQSYFVGRVAEIIRKKGKKPIGWNDILDGADNLTKETAIMSWLGSKAVKNAASKGFYTVATPTDPLYFDITQNDRNDGTPSDLAYGNINSIDKILAYNPTAGLTQDEEKYVLGVQANMWTALPQEVKDVNVQNFPRLLALAEIGWNKSVKKDNAAFNKKLDEHYKKLAALKIDYFKNGGYIVGTWDEKNTSSEFKTLSWDVTQKVYTNGRIMAGFFFTSGDSFLKVKNVKLLENGNPVNTDSHESLADKFRGTHKTKEFLYYLEIKNYKPKAKYTLTAEVANQKPGSSTGNVTFNLSPYQPFTVTEHTK